MKKASVAVLLAEGFEEIEAVVVIDILRRAQLEVAAVAVGDSLQVTGSRGVKVEADLLLGEVAAERLDMVVLPGGMPGAANLAQSEAVLDLVGQMDRAGKHLGAICAAPIVLQAAGLLKNRRATVYPGFEDRLQGTLYTGAAVEKDGHVITGKGPGAAFEFAFAIVEALDGRGTVEKLREAMLV